MGEARRQPAEIVTTSYARPEQVHAVFDILDERHYQDLQWGGPEHDDQHALADWLEFIEKQVRLAAESVDDPREFCARIIKIGALAVAAHESAQRRGRRNGQEVRNG